MSNYVLTPQAVRKLRGALAATPGNSGAAGAPSPVNIDDFPPPFTVRWSASARNKRGAWVIWLPDASSLVYVGNAYVSQITNIVAEVALPAGWYRMSPVSATATAVWLIVRTFTLTGAVRVSLGAYPGQPQTGYTTSSLLVATMETDAQTGAKRVKQFIDSAVVLGGEGGGVVPDDISTEFIPDPPEGTQPDGDEGQLQIKGFKSGQPADTNTLPDYLQGTAAIPSGGISIVCRGMTSDGRSLFYLPLAAIWGDGSSGGLPLPEVTYLDDVTWDSSNHRIVKHWVKKNIVTGVETPIQGAPQGKTATISTTKISSII